MEVRQWRKDKFTNILFMKKWEKFHSAASKSLNLRFFPYKFKKMFTTQREMICHRNKTACKIFYTNLPGSNYNYSRSIVSLSMWRTVGKQKIWTNVKQMWASKPFPSSGVVSEQVPTNLSKAEAHQQWFKLRWCTINESLLQVPTTSPIYL